MRRILTAALLLIAAHTGPAQVMGSLLPSDALQGLQNTKAKSFGDYEGRCVLIEFFAYW